MTTYNIWACSVEEIQVKTQLLVGKVGQGGATEGSGVSWGCLWAWRRASASGAAALMWAWTGYFMFPSLLRNKAEKGWAWAAELLRWHRGQPGRHTAPLSTPHLHPLWSPAGPVRVSVAQTDFSHHLFSGKIIENALRAALWSYTFD